MFDFLDVIVSPHDGDFWGSITGTCTRVDNCNTKTGGRASSMVGIAVRQLSGPRLRR